MEITLHNIGVIQDASIKLDGLTVITGKNESGKTTVGKALYALLDAVSDLPQKVKKARNASISRQLDKITDTSSVFRSFRMYRNQMAHDSKEHEVDILVNYPALQFLSGLTNIFIYSLSGQSAEEQLVRQTCEDMKLFRENLESNAGQLHDNPILKNYMKRFISSESDRGVSASIDSAIKSMDKQIAEDIRSLEMLLHKLEEEPNELEYSREAINLSLNVEFFGQIQPLDEINDKSWIRINDNDFRCFDVTIQNNRVINDCFLSSPTKKAYFVDNPFLLDSPVQERISKTASYELDSFMTINSNEAELHTVKLSRILHEWNNPPVQKPVSVEPRSVTEKINAIIPGTFDFSKSVGDYMLPNGKLLKIPNLATGSKMFSIIKILLDKGLLDEDAMLILDEPETHLHPAWQNQFAEMIVLLVKELRVKVLLTTHSSHFMLAIDAYMRKHKINDMANFYQARRLDNGYVTHDCVNDRMEVIYQDFLESFSEVKALRDYYDTDGDDES